MLRIRACAAAILVLGVLGGCDGAQADTGLTQDRLGAMIDSILPSLEAASGLEARAPIRYAVQDSADVRAFVESELESELEPGEFDGMERAYKAFGLLPDTLNLRSLLLDLYTEQVVGYYDPRQDQLFVVEGVEGEAAAPVVAHELVHALQDQHVDLEALMAPELGNDRQMAAQAAAEGQATLVMILLQARTSSGRDVDPGDLPDMGELLRPGMEAQNASFPVFRDAPRLIRETMLFPYLSGAAFVQALYRAAESGPPVPFGDLLPTSTEQVMNPRTHFLGDRDHPTDVALGPAPEGWGVVYENTLGKLEVSILLTEHLGGVAAMAANGWDGDRYMLLEDGDTEALVWYSVWDDEASADAFADAYRRVLDRRPNRAGAVTREAVDGRPVVRVVESEDAGVADALPPPGIRALTEAGT